MQEVAGSIPTTSTIKMGPELPTPFFLIEGPEFPKSDGDLFHFILLEFAALWCFVPIV